MSAQSIAVITGFIILLILWLLRLFVERKISAGQTIFWLVPLGVGQVLVWFPAMTDEISHYWGDLMPVSWISFATSLLLIFKLLHLTARMNRRYAFTVELARSTAYLEQRLRETEARCDELSQRLSRVS